MFGIIVYLMSSYDIAEAVFDVTLWIKALWVLLCYFKALQSILF